MRITSNVVLAGSGLLGFHTSNPLDCNLYLVDGGGECALIDAGSGLEPERIVANLEGVGVELSRLRQVLLTHAHGDHAAGARFWHDTYGVSVVCPREAAPWLKAGDEEKISLPAAKAAGTYPADFAFRACPVARAVGEGDEIQVGDITLRVVETPGHARGHVSYLTVEDGHTTLFGGDMVFAGGKIALLNTWDSSLHDYARSMARLHELHIDRLYPGHGCFLMAGADEDIARAHDKFEKLALPANIP